MACEMQPRNVCCYFYTTLFEYAKELIDKLPPPPAKLTKNASQTMAAKTSARRAARFPSARFPSAKKPGNATSAWKTPVGKPTILRRHTLTNETTNAAACPLRQNNQQGISAADQHMSHKRRSDPTASDHAMEEACSFDRPYERHLSPMTELPSMSDKIRA